MTIEEKTIKFIILAQLTIEASEEIKNTGFYKQSIKRKGNLFLNELMYVEKIIDKIYHKDNEMLTNAFKQVEQLVVKLTTSGIDDLIMLNQIQDYYKDNKEEWRDLYELELDKIEQ